MKDPIARVLAFFGFSNVEQVTATVDGALAEFQKAATKLEEAARHNETLIDLHEAALAKAEAAREAAKAELARAQAVGEKLKDLLGL